MELKEAKANTVQRQLLELAALSRPQLGEKWRELYGTEPPDSSREFLRRRLAYRIQEIHYGGLDPVLKKELMPTMVPHRNIANALRDGTKIVRNWKGDEYEVTIRGNKFEYQGQLYRSLSAIAKTITGTNWNGREFFGLTKR